jgi:hypothetical protein
MPLHEDQNAANRATLRTFNTGTKLGIIDATVAFPSTVGAGLKELQAAVTALNVHEDQRFPLVRINKALKVAYDIGTLTDANIIAATTVAGMQALWVAAALTLNDPITDPTMYGNVFWGE